MEHLHETNSAQARPPERSQYRRNRNLILAGLIAAVLLFIVIFYQVRLYSDLILHIVYVFLQIYGWHHWLFGGQGRDRLPVTVLASFKLGIWVIACASGALLWGHLMARFTDAALPYPDAFTTVASLIAQWLLARKRLDAWYFWIAVDIAAVGIYFSKGLFLTTGLYAVFLLLAVTGFFTWKKRLLAPSRIQAVSATSPA